MEKSSTAPDRYQQDCIEKSDMLNRIVREEVQQAVREQMLGMVRSVLNDLFKERILPRLLKYGEERIETIITTDLQRLMQERVDEELARLTSE